LLYVSDVSRSCSQTWVMDRQTDRRLQLSICRPSF